MGRGCLLASAVAIGTLLMGCGGSGTAPRPPAPDLTLGFTQLIPDEGTDQGLLRVTNDESEPVTVDAVGLDWPGYGPAFTGFHEATLAPGQTLDLRFTLPSPVCRKTDAEVSGIVETDAGRLVEPLRTLSQDYLLRLWRSQCDARLVDATVALRFVGGWQQLGSGQRPFAEGRLEVTRLGRADVELLRTTGSVLYDVELAAPVTLRTGRSSAEVAVRLLPGNRCDEHARGQATAPFDFGLWLRIDARRVLVPLPVPTAGESAAQTVLDRACGTVTTAD